jgi:hypothetical protein
MRTYPGRVTEIHLQPGRANIRQAPYAGIACPQGAIPQPGQYLLAVAEEDILGTPLYFAGPVPGGFLCAPPIPGDWRPGTGLVLCGPLGNGFHIPGEAKRLALIAAGQTAARLLPLAAGFHAPDAVALFTDAPLPPLPTSLEAYPLIDLGEALVWADFLAIDAPQEKLPEILEQLGAHSDGVFLDRGQILVETPMPCAGLGECGVCAIQTSRAARARHSPRTGEAWSLVCRQGPVFDIAKLLV